MVARRLQRLLYELFAFYAIFLGVTSFRYDFKLRLYKNTKWTQLIAGLSNLILVGVTVFDLAWVWFDHLKVDRVTEEIIQLDITVNDVFCLVRLLQRVPRERATANIERELRRLTRFYQYQCVRKDNDKQDMKRLRSIYLVKNCIMCFFTTFLMVFSIIAYQVLNLMSKNVFMEYSILILKTLAVNTQDIQMHLHFLLSCRICRLYMRLNSRIRELLKRNLPRDALELNRLCWLHMQLTCLMERLTATYAVIMISTRLSLIVSTAAMGYYISISECFPNNYKISGLVLYTLFALDGYVLDLILDWTVNEQRKTSILLRQHFELNQPDTQLSRRCDLFALQVACFPMQIKPYGMFTCSTATWLSNIACIISWMVVILQYRIVWENQQNNK